MRNSLFALALLTVTYALAGCCSAAPVNTDDYSADAGDASDAPVLQAADSAVGDAASESGLH